MPTPDCPWCLGSPYVAHAGQRVEVRLEGQLGVATPPDHLKAIEVCIEGVSRLHSGAHPHRDLSIVHPLGRQVHLVLNLYSHPIPPGAGGEGDYVGDPGGHHLDLGPDAALHHPHHTRPQGTHLAGAVWEEEVRAAPVPAASRPVLHELHHLLLPLLLLLSTTSSTKA